MTYRRLDPLEKIIFCCSSIKAANNKGADQTVQMHGLIYAFIVRIWHKLVFLWRGLIIVSIYAKKILINK